jgi:hypothetical protein
MVGHRGVNAVHPSKFLGHEKPSSPARSGAADWLKRRGPMQPDTHYAKSGDVRSDDIAGLAVHIAARVAALAQAGQVLVSSTVRDLVAGSNLRFADQGARALKGIPDKVRLFAVAN